MCSMVVKIPSEVIEAAELEAERIRAELAKHPELRGPLTAAQEEASAPFYFVLTEYIRQLKEARRLNSLTLSQVAERSGLAVESLSRLETGSQPNPTWRTLGLYAIAVGQRPELRALPAVEPRATTKAISVQSCYGFRAVTSVTTRQSTQPQVSKEEIVS